MSLNRLHLVRTADLCPIFGGAESGGQARATQGVSRLEFENHNWYNCKKWRRGRSAIDPTEVGGRGTLGLSSIGSMELTYGPGYPGRDETLMNRSSLQALVAGFRTGTLTPQTVLAGHLARLKRDESELNCFATLDERGAAVAAQLSGERWRAGKPLSRVDGVPISIKDTVPVAGLPTRFGSLVTSTAPATSSAPVVERLINAGAVVMGTTSAAEYGSAFVTISPLTGITRNARNPARTAGGSSGGAAVSVAAGFCAAAVGTDTGGSIRIPSSFNGVVGLKPTGGLLPTPRGSALHTLGSPGPIAASVADCAYLFATMADKRFGTDDPACPEGLPAPPIALQEVRFAVTLRLGFAAYVDPQIEAAIRAPVIRLRDVGCKVREFETELADPFPVYQTITNANYAALLGGLGESEVAKLSPILRAARAAGLQLKATDLLAAQAARFEFAQALERALGPYDILITPTVAVPPFAAHRFVPDQPPLWPQDTAAGWCPFCYPFNLSTQPALSIPCASTADGLPIGCQLVAPAWQDAMLLQVGQQIECLLSEAPLQASANATQNRPGVSMS